MTAVNLARLADDPLEITIVNERTPPGRGVAYRRRRPEYLLNVATRNMSAFPDDSDHFLRWVSTRPEYEAVPEIDLRERFIPRQTYGDYLSSIAQKYLATPGDGISSRFVIGEAVDVEPEEFGCAVRLADGTTLKADRVVLATGNETPHPCPAQKVLSAIERGSAIRGRPGRSGCHRGTQVWSFWVPASQQSTQSSPCAPLDGWAPSTRCHGTDGFHTRISKVSSTPNSRPRESISRPSASTSWLRW